jgi:hypothetical protein
MPLEFSANQFHSLRQLRAFVALKLGDVCVPNPDSTCILISVKKIGR